MHACSLTQIEKRKALDAKGSGSQVGGQRDTGFQENNYSWTWESELRLCSPSSPAAGPGAPGASVEGEDEPAECLATPGNASAETAGGTEAAAQPAPAGDGRVPRQQHRSSQGGDAEGCGVLGEA